MLVKLSLFLGLLAIGVFAFDFTSIAPGKTERLSDGHIRVTHTLHKKFDLPDGNKSFIDLDAKVEYHESWNFVDLFKFAADGGVGSSAFCHNASVKDQLISVVVKNASTLTELKNAIAKPKTIVKFSGLRCGGQAVFGHFEKVDSIDGFEVKIAIRTAQLEEVFRSAKVRMQTNHVAARAYTPEESDAVLRKDLEKEDIPLPAASTSRRSMKEQHHHWGHHLKHELSRSYKHVTHVAKEVGKDVEHLAKDVDNAYNRAKGMFNKAEKTVKHVATLAEGDFKTNKDWTLASATWGSSNLKYNPLIEAPTNGVAHEVYAHFDLQVVFEVDIHHYHLESFKAAVIGNAEAVASFAAGESHTGEYSKQLCDIRLTPISFSIGPVPVHIQTYIPVVFGLNYNTQGALQMAATATGYVEYGYQYQSGQFSPIAVHKFAFTKQHALPRTPVLDISMSLTPSVVLNVDFIGGPIASLDLVFSANLVDDSSPAFVQFNGKTSVVLSALFKLRVDGHTVLGPETVGPHRYDATSYDLGGVEIPKIEKHTFAKLSSDMPLKTGTTFRGRGVSSEACPYNQDVTFQSVGVEDDETIAMMAVISTTATEPTTKQNGFANIIAPYYLAADVNGMYNLFPANISDVSATTSASWLPVHLPTFKARIIASESSAPSMELSQQIGGLPMCTSSTNNEKESEEMVPMVMTSGVFTKTATQEKHTETSGSKNNQASNTNKNVIMIGAASSAAALVVLSIIIVKLALRRRSTVPTNENSANNADLVPMNTVDEA